MLTYNSLLLTTCNMKFKLMLFQTVHPLYNMSAWGIVGGDRI